MEAKGRSRSISSMEGGMSVSARKALPWNSVSSSDPVRPELLPPAWVTPEAAQEPPDQIPEPHRVCGSRESWAGQCPQG